MAKTKKKRKRFDCVMTDDGVVHALSNKTGKRYLRSFFLCNEGAATRTFRRQRKRGLLPTCLGCLAKS